MTKISVLAVALLLLAGCAHSINLKGFEHHGSMPGDLHGKRIAIVVDSSRLKDNFATHTDVHTFNFSGISDGVVGAIKERSGTETAEISIFTIDKIPADKVFDYYFYPEFTARTVHDFWTLGCLETYTLTVKSMDQKKLTSESAEAKRSFLFMSKSEAGCREAATEIFNLVMDKIFDSINVPNSGSTNLR